MCDSELTTGINNNFADNMVNRSQNKKNLLDSTVSNKLEEFSTIGTVTQLSKLYSKPPQTPYEFGGWIGAMLLIISFISYVLGLYILCDEKECSFTRLPNFDSYNYKLQLETLIYYLALVYLLALIQALPFGGKKVVRSLDKNEKVVYILNGNFTAFVVFAIVLVLQICDYDVTGYIVDNIFYFLISALGVSFLYSIWLFINSYLGPITALNSYVAWKNPIYAFFMGRQLHPKLHGIVDLKIYGMRLTSIGGFLINYAYVCKVISLSNEFGEISLKSINLSPTLMTFFIISSIYFLDGLFTEKAWLTSFEMQQEGFGFMGCVGYSVYPFMLGSTLRYIVNYNVNLATWKLLLSIIVFLFGYLLYRGSNNQKASFRENPNSPASANMETISTGQDKKLLVSGFWGRLRHPNYLGDILINLSFIPFGLFVPPVLTPVFTIVLLIHRSVRDNSRCKEKYGPAWDRYCSGVKYILVPKLY